MRDLVHRLRFRVARVMSHSECEVPKREAFTISDEPENYAELAVRSQQVGLEAAGSFVPVAALEIAAAQAS